MKTNGHPAEFESGRVYRVISQSYFFARIPGKKDVLCHLNQGGRFLSEGENPSFQQEIPKSIPPHLRTVHFRRRSQDRSTREYTLANAWYQGVEVNNVEKFQVPQLDYPTREPVPISRESIPPHLGRRDNESKYQYKVRLQKMGYQLV